MISSMKVKKGMLEYLRENPLKEANLLRRELSQILKRVEERGQPCLTPLSMKKRTDVPSPIAGIAMASCRRPLISFTNHFSIPMCFSTALMSSAYGAGCDSRYYRSFR